LAFILPLVKSLRIESQLSGPSKTASAGPLFDALQASIIRAASGVRDVQFREPVYAA
jgi:hypothetical protein